jgi:hypothetical protein
MTATTNPNQEVPMIAVDKNIPMPAQCRRGPRPKYPFLLMQKGDSFFVNGGTKLSTIQSSASQAGRRYGRKFACRPMGNGIRVWRIK